MLAGRAALLAAAALLFTALFFGDGTSNGRLFWIGSLAAIAAAVLAVRGGLPAPRGAGAIAFGLLAALTAWVGLTMWWSIAPDLSWAAFDRLLAYGAIALLGLVATRAPRPARTAAAGLALLLGLVLAWALLGKVIPSLFPDGARVARLRNPVGYWNSLALVAATAVPFGLWAACSRRFHPAARASGALLVYLAELVVVLTYSRAGIAVAGVAALAWLAIDRDRLETLGTLVLVTPVAGLVALWTFSRPALTDDLQPYADRVNDGAWFGILLCLGAAVVCLLAYFAARVEVTPERRRSLTRALAVVVAVVAVVAVAVVVARKGGSILDEFRGAKTAEVTQTPEPPRRPQLEQPMAVVAGGVAALRGRSGRGPRGGDVRGRPAGDQKRIDRHHRAARPPAPVPGRDRGGRVPPVARADRGRYDGGGDGRPPGRAGRARGGDGSRPGRRRVRAPLAGRHPLGVRRRRRAGVLLVRRARRARGVAARRPSQAGLGGCSRAGHGRRPLLTDRAVRVGPARRLGLRGDRGAAGQALRCRTAARPAGSTRWRPTRCSLSATPSRPSPTTRPRSGTTGMR